MAISFALFVLVALLGNVHCQFGRDEIPNECREKEMDIFFLLDSSTSIYINDYREQHDFVRDVVSRLDVSDRFTRVGALTFSDDFTRPVQSLRDSRSQTEVINSITETNLPYRTGITNTHAAIRYVRENNEFRGDVTKVMVVVTDGGSRQQGSTAREAQLAREAGFYLFVVGVGQYRDESEWRAIASDPDDRFIYNITEFRQLSSVANTLPSRVCPLPPIVLGCNVEQPADLIFVGGPADNQRALEVVEYFVGNTRDDLAELQLTLLIDSCSDASRIEPARYTYYCDTDAFDRQTVPSETTFSDLLQQVEDAMDSNRISRPTARQVVVFMLDQTTASYARNQARELRFLDGRANVEVVVLGLGVRSRDMAYFQNEIREAVTLNSGPLSYQSSILRSFVDSTCQGINERTRRLDNSPN